MVTLKLMLKMIQASSLVYVKSHICYFHWEKFFKSVSSQVHFFKCTATHQLL